MPRATTAASDAGQPPRRGRRAPRNNRLQSPARGDVSSPSPPNFEFHFHRRIVVSKPIMEDETITRTIEVAAMTDATLQRLLPQTTSAVAKPSPAREPLTGRHLSRAGAIGWIAPAVLLVAWQISASSGILSASILPNPLDVARAAWRLTLSGELLANVGVSAMRALAGLVVGGFIGLAFAFANGLSRWSDAFTDTTLQMVRNVPHLALIPLVIVWFGIDEGAKLFLVALGVFFPIYLNTLHGIRSVDPQLVEMGRSYGLSPGALFSRIILPGALPSIFVGLRFALGITWLTLIVAETIAAQSGIGYMAMQAREFMQLDVVILAILIYAALGKLADSTVRVLERTFLSWNPVFQKETRA
jgi:sulfonate transport system permease protein